MGYQTYLVTQPIEKPVMASQSHQSGENDLELYLTNTIKTRNTFLTDIVDY